MAISRPLGAKHYADDGAHSGIFLASTLIKCCQAIFFGTVLIHDPQFCAEVFFPKSSSGAKIRHGESHTGTPGDFFSLWRKRGEAIPGSRCFGKSLKLPGIQVKVIQVHAKPRLPVG